MTDDVRNGGECVDILHRGCQPSVTGKIAAAFPYANRPCPYGICEPPLKGYAMQIFFDVGIPICRHVFIPIGIYLRERAIL
jgi:hypothetical protein